MSLLVLIGISCGKSYEKEILEKAEKHFKNSEYKEAVNNYTKLIDIGENQFDLYLKTAKSFIKLKNYASALKMLKKAENKKPGIIEVKFLLGKVYANYYNPGVARNFFNIVISKGSEEEKAKAYIEKAKLDWDSKEEDPKIINLLKKAQGIVNSGENYIPMIRYYYKLKMYDKAVSVGEKALKIEFKNNDFKAELLFLMAKSFGKSKNYKKAMSYAFKAVNLNPNKYQYAKFYKKMEKNKKKADSK